MVLVEVSYNIYLIYILNNLRIPLNRMKSTRRTIGELGVARQNIARRWSASSYSKLPEEPITNYLDVS